MISGFEIPSCAGDGEHDSTACRVWYDGRSKVGSILYDPLVNGGADRCFSPSNAGSSVPAASSEPKRTRGTRTHGKRKPHRPKHLSVDFRSTGSSNLVHPASQAVLPKRQNDDISGDGREMKKARHAEIETKVNGLTKEIEEMKDSLARIDEKRKIKESRHPDSESPLTQDATDLKGLRKEIEELKDLVARSLDEMKKDQESRHADSGSSPRVVTIAQSTGDENNMMTKTSRNAASDAQSQSPDDSNDSNMPARDSTAFEQS